MGQFVVLAISVLLFYVGMKQVLFIFGIWLFYFYVLLLIIVIGFVIWFLMCFIDYFMDWVVEWKVGDIINEENLEFKWYFIMIFVV